MKKFFGSILLLLSFQAQASVSLPYSFSPNQLIQSSQVNADVTALMNEINTHEALKNGHFTALSDILNVNNSCGTTPINFNETQALGFRAENLPADPTPGHSGRLFYNTTTNLLKVDTGSALIPIGGINVPNLSTVLGGGNSAGTYDLDMNGNQLLHARVENLSANPSAGTTGRLFFNTTANSLELDTGSAILPIGGAQNLSQVLTIGNSAGSSSLNMNENQLLSARLENVASLPTAGNAGRLVFDTANSTFYGDNGSVWATLNGITALTGDVSATGPGSVSATVNTVGGSSAANVHSAELLANAATNSNTASTLVKRDASGNFSAGTITANLTGTASGNISTTVMTTNGDLIYGAASGTATRLAGPTSATKQFLTSTGTGSAANAPAWGTLSAGDIPALSYVTSVGLSAPSIFTVSGSPVTASGTLGFSLNTQSANMIFAGPSTGVAAAPTFRALAGADIPAINLGSTGNGGVTGSLPPGSIAQSGASTNQSLVWNGSAWAPGSVGGGALSVTGSTASPQAITAAGGIAFSGAQSRSLWFIQGSGGAITVTASPEIAAATTVGQELILEGTSDTNTLTLSDGTGLSLNGSMTLYAHSSLYLVWDGSVWTEINRRQ